MKNKINKRVLTAFIYVKCTYKNTIITVTNSKKETILQKSTRGYDLKMKRKNNPFILNKISTEINDKLIAYKYKQLGIFIEGVGTGRYFFLKNFSKNFKIRFIVDKTRIPFNGCRAKKKKRK